MRSGQVLALVALLLGIYVVINQFMYVGRSSLTTVLAALGVGLILVAVGQFRRAQ
jgi:hypothetical protein